LIAINRGCGVSDKLSPLAFAADGLYPAGDMENAR